MAIVLLRPANIGGEVKPAGSLVSGMPPAQEQLFVDAGNAEWPGEAESPEQRAESEGVARKPTHDQLDARAKELNIEFVKRLTIDQKLAVIAEAEEAESGEPRAESSEAQAAVEARKAELLALTPEELSAVAVGLGIEIGAEDTGEEVIDEIILRETAEAPAAADAGVASMQSFGRSGRTG